MRRGVNLDKACGAGRPERGSRVEVYMILRCVIVDTVLLLQPWTFLLCGLCARFFELLFTIGPVYPRDLDVI